MKYTDGNIAVDAVQFHYGRSDLLNLQHIGFSPMIINFADKCNPKLRIDKCKYINIDDYLVRMPDGRFVGLERNEFERKFKLLSTENEK